MGEPNKHYEELFDSVPVGLYMTTPGGDILDVNTALINTLRYPDKETLLEKEASSVFVNKQDRQKWIEEMECNRATVVNEYQWNCFDGTVIWVRDTARAVHDEKGSVTYYIGVIEDITNSKQEEKQLRLLSSIVEQSTEGIALADLSGYLIFTNQAWCNMHGYKDSKNLLGKNLAIFHNKEQLENDVILFNEKVKKYGTHSGDVGHISKDGEPFPTLMTTTLLNDEQGKPYAFVGFAMDITERKQAEEALKESEEKSRSITYSANDAIILVDNENKVSQWNAAAEKIFGFSSDEVVGKQLHKLLVPRRFYKTAIKGWLKFAKTGKGPVVGKTVEISALKKDGTEIQIELSISALRLKGKWNAIGIIRDISERKAAEEQLRSSEERLKILFDEAPDGYYLNDFTGNFLDGNKAAEKITGYKREELIGKNFLKLKLLPANQIAQAAKGLAMNAMGRATGPDEYILSRKDGTQIPVQINSHPVNFKGKKVVLGIARDITKQKLAEEMLKEYTENLERIVGERARELREAQEELLRSERLAMLGKLAGGIGHDLRTPLGAIKNAVYFLNMEVENPGPEVKEMLEVIEKEISVSNGIITGMLDFARPKEAKKQEVDVNNLLQETVSRVHVPENIEVEWFITEKLPHILVDPVQIGQIFANIIQNGFQAMPDGGKLVVESKAVESGQVAVSFSDTGVGISEENLKKLFEPLFTTKASGTGLGLALVEMLVERNGGAIQVKSEEGQGSTFTVTFPARPR